MENKILVNTPRKTIDSLLNYMEFIEVKSFLDPYRGEGGIYNAIPVNKKESCGENDTIDYFDFVFKKDQFDLIITNPHMTSVEKSIEKSLREAKTVCYLLPLRFLSGRKLWWKKVGTPNKLLVLSTNPYIDNVAYGWFCWDKGNYIIYKDGIYVI